MKDGGQGTAGGRRAVSISNLLVVAEMALCIVLLAGAGLMIRSAVNLYGAPIGVNPTNVLTMHVNLPEAKYPSPADQAAFHRLLKTRLDSLPGVEAAAVVSNLPFGGYDRLPYELEGAVTEPGRAPRAGAIIASSDYFRVLRVNPRRGRIFTQEDGIIGPPVVLVNQSFSAKLWPGQDAIGKRLRLMLGEGAPADTARWLTVVGVIPDILQNFQRPLEHDALIYIPYWERPRREVFVVARTRIPPERLADPFRRAVQHMNPNLAVYDLSSLEDRLAQTRLSARLLGGMFTVFAVIALVLATVGLYAVIAHSTTQRIQEIGVRMALGGTRRDILRLVFVEGMRPMIVGLLLGLPLAFGVTHVLRMVLVGVSPGDPTTFAACIVVLAAAGALGCAIPARKAMRIDPMKALRYE